MGLITLLTKAFCSCHYLGFAPVLYGVNFLERLSRAAKGILLCQRLHFLLSLYPGRHLSPVAASLAMHASLMPDSVPVKFKEALLEQKDEC